MKSRLFSIPKAASCPAGVAPPPRGDRWGPAWLWCLQKGASLQRQRLLHSSCAASASPSGSHPAPWIWDGDAPLPPPTLLACCLITASGGAERFVIWEQDAGQAHLLRDCLGNSTSLIYEWRPLIFDNIWLVSWSLGQNEPQWGARQGVVLGAPSLSK